jgi:hypothetical protein
VKTLYDTIMRQDLAEIISILCKNRLNVFSLPYLKALHLFPRQSPVIDILFILRFKGYKSFIFMLLAHVLNSFTEPDCHFTASSNHCLQSRKTNKFLGMLLNNLRP